MHIIQKELDNVVILWNTHRVRPSTNTIAGIPDVLYKLPVLNGNMVNLAIIYTTIMTGTRDYKCSTSATSLVHAFRRAEHPPPPVSYEYLRAAYMIMSENNITSMPSDVYQALELFVIVTTAFDI